MDPDVGRKPLRREVPHISRIASPEQQLDLAHRTLKAALGLSHQERAARERGEAVEPALPEPLQAERYLSEVQASGDFTADWFTEHIPRIYQGLESTREVFRRYLEVGCFEGLSTVWFARYLSQKAPQPALTAIDFFANIPGLGPYERRFDHNARNFLASVRLRKIKAPSSLALAVLLQERRAFDLIYVDGSHRALDVAVDACLAWQLLRPGGVILFDDYFWVHDYMPRRTLEGINAFLDLVEGQFTVVSAYWQVMLRKNAPVPAPPRAAAP